MTQEIEIEFKNLLTKTEFNTILNLYHVGSQDFFIQKNIYFDTESMCLQKKQAALRIRIKDGRSQLTLKQKQEEQMLETHQILTNSQYHALYNTGILPDGNVRDIVMLECLSPHPLIKLGELTTKRAEKPYLNGTLVFDYSTYLGQEDYELEYEALDYKEGQAAFQELLTKHCIPARPTKNKIARLFDAIQTNKKERPTHER